jgi:hypothetical protein
MKPMVLESQIQHNDNQLNSAEPIKSGRLTAKWLVVDGRLVCQWIIT